MFYSGVMLELSRLKWENELYQKDLLAYISALKAIHKVIQVTPNNVEAIEIILERAGI